MDHNKLRTLLPEAPSFLSEKEAAAHLSISLSTIRRRRRDRCGPAFVRFGGVLRYSRQALDEFVASKTNSPQQAAA